MNRALSISTFLLLFAGQCAGDRAARSDQPTKAVLKAESFDRDPGWLSWNNRIVPQEYPTIVQDFGYNPTHFAGRAAGEMGGRITRASEPAFYADKIASTTLDDKFGASGTFAITKTTSGGGIFFGFLRAQQPHGSGRPIASLGLHMGCEHSGTRLAVRLITGQNQSCGTFITPFIPGKFRPTPIRSDGTRYSWMLDYDPQAADGRGRFTFALHSDSHQPGELENGDLPESHKEEARTHFPSTTTFSVDLPEGYKQQGTTFDHFGLMNMMKAGGQMEIYFDDLEYAGRQQEFSQDPKWDAAGNRVRYRATDVGGAHDFGFSNTNHAGGQPGEIGGTFWRTDKWGYYADKIEPLSFEDRLDARGKVILAVGAPDADMCFGWFHTDDGNAAPNKAGTFLGIKVGGPTRVGHYFLPTFTVTEELRGLPQSGPILRPAKVYEWSLTYDPTAAEGKGTITATLGTESVTHVLKPGQKAKAKDARLDRFGMFSIGPGGQIVKLYLDDLRYTASKTTR